MSLSQLNNLLKDELEYRLAFLTTKNGKSMRRLSTCKVVNLQFSFFSTSIWLERIFICSITPIMHLIARLSSFFAKKLRRSEIIFVSLLTALKFYLYCLAIIKILIFCELYKLQSLFYSKITLNHACEFSLAKLQLFIKCRCYFNPSASPVVLNLLLIGICLFSYCFLFYFICKITLNNSNFQIFMLFFSAILHFVVTSD